MGKMAKENPNNTRVYITIVKGKKSVAFERVLNDAEFFRFSLERNLFVESNLMIVDTEDDLNQAIKRQIAPEIEIVKPDDIPLVCPFSKKTKWD